MTRSCEWCGREFSIVHYWLSKGVRRRRVDERRFCSPACGGTATAKQRKAVAA